MKEDKIFNNRYNSGDIEYEVFGEIKMLEQDSALDGYEAYLEGKVQEELYQIFIESPYYTDSAPGKSSKVPRSEVATIYYYFEDRLTEKEEVTPVEKFTRIAEFMCIPYDVLYQEISPVHKERLLRELDSKYHVFSKNKIKRLF
jgi:hypothetical protein